MSDAERGEKLFYSRFAAEADMRELVELFVSELPRRIKAMNQCLERSDWLQLGRLAHQLKGASGSYGFDQLGSAAAATECACREPKADCEIRAAFRRLIDLCQRVRPGAAAQQPPGLEVSTTDLPESPSRR